MRGWRQVKHSLAPNLTRGVSLTETIHALRFCRGENRHHIRREQPVSRESRVSVAGAWVDDRIGWVLDRHIPCF